MTNMNEPPATPTGVTVSANQENATAAIDVSWTAPDTVGAPVTTGYQVQFRESGQDDWIDHRVGGTDTKTSIDGLSAGIVYEARVRAMNEEGESGWSTPGNGTAQASGIFSQPTPRPSEQTRPSTGGLGDQETNTAPQFDTRNFTLGVDENSTRGAFVGSAILAKDPDSHDSITYALFGDGTRQFHVDRKSGQITVTGELDFETKHTYLMTMIATDQGGLEG